MFIEVLEKQQSCELCYLNRLTARVGVKNNLSTNRQRKFVKFNTTRTLTSLDVTGAVSQLTRLNS